MARLAPFLTLLIGLFLCGLGAAQDSDFALVDPDSLDFSLAAGETANQSVSITILPFCIRAFEIDVVASDPAALVTNSSGVQTNGCGGDVSTFEVQIEGTGDGQSFDLHFVDAEFGGVLATIPVAITPTGPPPPAPAAESAGERSTLLACFYECNPDRRDRWKEVTSILLANPGREPLHGVAAYYDGNQNLVAQSPLVLEADDVDELYVCRTLNEGGVTPPRAGMIHVSFSAGPEAAIYGWVKDWLGKFPERKAEPLDGFVIGLAKTQCRVVPPSVNSAEEIAAKVQAASPPVVEPRLIEGTAD